MIGSEQVQQQLAHHGAFAADSDTSPREVLASALGNRLGRMVVGGEKLFSCEFRSYVIVIEQGLARGPEAIRKGHHHHVIFDGPNADH